MYLPALGPSKTNASPPPINDGVKVGNSSTVKSQEGYGGKRWQKSTNFVLSMSHVTHKSSTWGFPWPLICRALWPASGGTHGACGACSALLWRGQRGGSFLLTAKIRQKFHPISAYFSWLWNYGNDWKIPDKYWFDGFRPILLAHANDLLYNRIVWLTWWLTRFA